MACRVGMATDPEARIRFWKQREGHTYSTILARNLTYEQAQAREEREARQRNCHWRSGGGYVAGWVWSVYYLSGGVIRGS